MASLAGSWMALIVGFGGMRARNGCLSFAPKLPGAISRLAFRVLYRGRCVEVEAQGGAATYRLVHGEPLDVRHYGSPLTLGPEPLSFPIAAQPALPRPHQPRGHAPAQRHTRRHGNG
ncbi:MAG: glycosyl hydrolase family 65 protein [Actinomycetota bacterium]